MDQNAKKQAVGRAAVKYVEPDTIIGVGTGSTVNYFIDALADIKHQIAGAVSSSVASTERLKALGIDVFELNEVDSLSIYVDGADEVTEHKHMIKGGGAALTQEKIVSAVAKTFDSCCWEFGWSVGKLMGWSGIQFVGRKFTSCSSFAQLRLHSLALLGSFGRGRKLKIHIVKLRPQPQNLRQKFKAFQTKISRFQKSSAASSCNGSPTCLPPTVTLFVQLSVRSSS